MMDADKAHFLHTVGSRETRVNWILYQHAAAEGVAAVGGRTPGALA